MTHSYEPVSDDDTRAVDTAITTRRSVRGFLDTPVPRDVVEQILDVASRAPSGSNIQPWHVTVLTGESLAGLSAALHAAHDDADRAPTREYEYYPIKWFSPYVDRRRTLGWELYRLAGIAKGDKARMHVQHGLNFDFFGAPVGLIFTIDRALEQGSWIDYGAFIQSVMVAARGRGLDTCAQAAFADFPDVVARFIGAPDNEMLVCGMALGHADPAAEVNALVTEREPASRFTRFLG